MKRIIIVTDTWEPSVNGVVTSIRHTKNALEKNGWRVRIVHPGDFVSLPMPSYPEVRITLPWERRIQEIIAQEQPDYIHIATEGSLGLGVRYYCIQNRYQFTTAYHTRFPEYVQMRMYGFGGVTRRYLQWFHNGSNNTIVSTASLQQELIRDGFTDVVVAPLGVDTEIFKRNPDATLPPGVKGPLFIYVGRVAIEKNLRAFLECDLPGTKMIIGDGPDSDVLEKEFPGAAMFVGYQRGQELINLLSVADCMVFPSKTDTLGLVILEALSCGVPIAAYDVGGPRDIVENGVDGYLGDDLTQNALQCLHLSREACRNKALQFSWERSIEAFVQCLVPITSLEQ